MAQGYGIEASGLGAIAQCCGIVSRGLGRIATAITAANGRGVVAAGEGAITAVLAILPRSSCLPIGSATNRCTGYPTGLGAAATSSTDTCWYAEAEKRKPITTGTTCSSAANCCGASSIGHGTTSSRPTGTNSNRIPSSSATATATAERSRTADGGHRATAAATAAGLLRNR